MEKRKECAFSKFATKVREQLMNWSKGLCFREILTVWRNGQAPVPNGKKRNFKFSFWYWDGTVVYSILHGFKTKALFCDQTSSWGRERRCYSILKIGARNTEYRVMCLLIAAKAKPGCPSSVLSLLGGSDSFMQTGLCTFAVQRLSPLYLLNC